MSTSSWRHSVAILGVFQDSMLETDVLTVFEACAEHWQAALLMADFQCFRVEGQDVDPSMTDILVGKGLWQQAMSLRLVLEQNGLPSKDTETIQVFSRALEWQRAVSGLMHLEGAGLGAFDSVLLACWKSLENAMAFRLLRDSSDLRSATSYLWGLSVLHETCPTTIHAACLDAWMAMRHMKEEDSNLPSNFDLITTWWSSAVLGASNSDFQEFLATEALRRMSSLSLEELSTAIQGAAFTSFTRSSGKFFSFAQDFAEKALRGELSRDWSFAHDGKEVLALLFACQMAGCLSSTFRDKANKLLREVGRAMDKGLPAVAFQVAKEVAQKFWPTEICEVLLFIIVFNSFCNVFHNAFAFFTIKANTFLKPLFASAGGSLKVEDLELITTWPDRPVILKPPGWEARQFLERLRCLIFGVVHLLQETLRLSTSKEWLWL